MAALGQPTVQAPSAPTSSPAQPPLADPFAIAREKVSQGAAPNTLPNYTQFTPQQQSVLTQTYAKTKQAQSGASSAPVQPPSVRMAGTPAQPSPQTPPMGTLPPPASPQAAPSSLPPAASAPSKQSVINYDPLSGPPAGATQVTPTPNAPTPEIAKFTGAQYKPPNKGLEYAAMAIALLFPGSAASYAASGLIRGLNQGAENRYNREEGQAETKYKTDEAATQARNRTALAQWQNNVGDIRARDEASQRIAAAKWNVDLSTWQSRVANGQDPRTGAAIPVPQNLQRILPPGSKRLPSAADYAQHNRALASWANSIGATNRSSQYDATAAAYDKMMIDEQNNARAMQVAMMHVQATLAGQQGMESRFERGEMFRYLTDNKRESDTEIRNQQATYRQEAERLTSSYRSEYLRAFPAFTKDAAGNLVATNFGPQRAHLAELERRWVNENSPDPVGVADWIAQYTPDQSVAGLLQSYGQAMASKRQALGMPLGEFNPNAFKASLLPKDLQTKIRALTPTQQAAAYAAALNGIPAEQIRKTIDEFTATPHPTEVTPDPVNDMGATNQEAIGL